MYRLLIVEDEDIIRAGIRLIIEEMELGIHPILEASCGKQALEIARREDVHLLVTDIKMEGGDGLELLRELSKAGLRCKTIILSGYGQFAYAQQAISLGVGEYLLKPIKKKNLREALTKLIAQLDAERIAPSEAPSGEASRAASPSGRLLGDIAQGKVAASEVGRKLADAGLGAGCRSYYAASLRSGRGERGNAELVRRLEGRRDSGSAVLAACESEPGHILLFVGTDEPSAKGSPRQAHVYLRKLLASCGIDGANEWTMGISEEAGGPERLPRLIEQSAYALDCRLLQPAQRHFYYKDTVPNGSLSSSSAASGPAPNVFLQTVRSSLRDGNRKAATEALVEWFRFIRRQEGITPSFVVDALYGLLVYSELATGGEPTWSSRTHSELTSLYRSSASFEDFQAAVLKRLDGDRPSGAEAKAAGNGAFDSNAISFIVQYLECHYDKDITLRSAADQIFMNPSYFSSLFKKKTGINFVHYLQKLRIEKSKALLRDPKYKIYEVATKIGFADEKYFFKVFKNVTGITPNEYRDRREPV